MDATVGVYVHVPFCERVCPYCDFAVEPLPRRGEAEAWPAVESRYVDALLGELAARAPDFEGCRLESLYFGGGTPSLLRPESIARVHAAVRDAFPAAGPVEVTLELNPGSTERERLPALRSEAGVTRLSVGVQSFDDSLLKALGRAHAADACHLTLAAARAAGFDDVSVDLIFAALHQTRAMLDADLDAVLDFAPEHVSTYELVLEPGTPFGRAAERGRLAPLPEDACAEMVEQIESRLVGAGYERYELTNYARPGRASRHNRRYWARAPVLGIGAGAHSLDPPSAGRPYGTRRANPRARGAWLAALEAGRPAAAAEEVPDRETALAEAFFLALRTARGLSAEAVTARFGAPPRAHFPEAVAALCERGLLTEDAAGDLRLTARGRMLADEVGAHFVPDPAD